MDAGLRRHDEEGNATRDDDEGDATRHDDEGDATRHDDEGDADRSALRTADVMRRPARLRR
ncbi:MAG: hypothetical protein ABSC95_10250 [Acetobacteraceae bacterium]